MEYKNEYSWTNQGNSGWGIVKVVIEEFVFFKLDVPRVRSSIQVL